jgi:hypothetical protein
LALTDHCGTWKLTVDGMVAPLPDLGVGLHEPSHEPDGDALLPPLVVELTVAEVSARADQFACQRPPMLTAAPAIMTSVAARFSTGLGDFDRHCSLG